MGRAVIRIEHASSPYSVVPCSVYLENCFHQICLSQFPNTLSVHGNCPNVQLIYFISYLKSCSNHVTSHGIPYGETAIIFPIRHCLSFAYTCVYAQCVTMLLAATMLHCVNKNSISRLSLSFVHCLLGTYFYLYTQKKKLSLWYICFVFIFSLFRSAVVWRTQILCVRCKLQ